MQSSDRSYRPLTARRPREEVLGELTLAHHIDVGATAFVHDIAAVLESHQLRYAGQWPIQLRPEHQLVQVELVRSDGSPALVGNYLVDMLPQTSMFSSEEHFVSNGCQRVPLAGISFLQPGDVLGMASAPLLQVPLSAIPHGDLNDDPQAAAASSTSPAGDTGDFSPPSAESFVCNLHERSAHTGGPGTVPDAAAPSQASPPSALLERLTPEQRIVLFACGTLCPRICEKSRSICTVLVGHLKSSLIWARSCGSITTFFRALPRILVPVRCSRLNSRSRQEARRLLRDPTVSTRQLPNKLMPFWINIWLLG